MAVISGFVALGTGYQAGAFQELGGTYTRPALSLSGTAAAGLTQALGSIATSSATPVGAPIRLGAIFDAVTAGNLLMWWEWATLPLTDVGTLFPATTINFALYGNISAEIFQNGGAIDPGAMIGTVNGAPLVAGNRLLIQGGNIVFESATTRMHENPIFTLNGLNVGKFDGNGNLVIRGTVTASQTTI